MPRARGIVSWAYGRCLFIINLFIHLFSKNGLSAYDGQHYCKDTSVNEGDRGSHRKACLLVGGDQISRSSSLLEDDTCRAGGVGAASMKRQHLHKDMGEREFTMIVSQGRMLHAEGWPHKNLKV